MGSTQKGFQPVGTRVGSNLEWVLPRQGSHLYVLEWLLPMGTQSGFYPWVLEWLLPRQCSNMYSGSHPLGHGSGSDTQAKGAACLQAQSGDDDELMLNVLRCHLTY